MSAVRPAASRNSRLMWLAIAAAAVVLVFAVIFASRFGIEPGVTGSPLIDQPMPSFVIPHFDTGEPFDSSTLNDGGVTVINFWASWCIGCRTEHEALLLAAEQYRDAGVTFLGINYQDGIANGSRFLDELGRSSQTTYLLDDESRAALEFGVLGLPETFFIDQSGTVVGKVNGPVSYALLTSTIDAILIGERVGEVTTGETENLDTD